MGQIRCGVFGAFVGLLAPLGLVAIPDFHDGFMFLAGFGVSLPGVVLVDEGLGQGMVAEVICGFSRGYHRPSQTIQIVNLEEPVLHAGGEWPGALRGVSGSDGGVGFRYLPFQSIEVFFHGCAVGGSPAKTALLFIFSVSPDVKQGLDSEGGGRHG